jgi:hypothetical protein
MHLSRLVSAFSLFSSANAFNLYGDDYIPKDACDKALSAEIDCQKDIASYLGGYSSLPPGENNLVCTETCSRSLRTWYTTVSNDCKHARVKAVERIWSGWNITCQTDTRTGRYCIGP